MNVLRIFPTYIASKGSSLILENKSRHVHEHSPLFIFKFSKACCLVISAYLRLNIPLSWSQSASVTDGRKTTPGKATHIFEQHASVGSMLVILRNSFVIRDSYVLLCLCKYQILVMVNDVKIQFKFCSVIFLLGAMAIPMGCTRLTLSNAVGTNAVACQ